MRHLPNVVYYPKGMKDSKLPKGGINVFAVLLHTHLAGNLIN